MTSPSAPDPADLGPVDADHLSGLFSVWLSTHAWPGYGTGEVLPATDEVDIYSTTPPPADFRALASQYPKVTVHYRTSRYNLTQLTAESTRLTAQLGVGVSRGISLRNDASGLVLHVSRHVTITTTMPVTQVIRTGPLPEAAAAQDGSTRAPRVGRSRGSR